MESSSKRRKLNNAGSGLKHQNLIDFQSPDATRLSSSSIFTLQTDELLKSAKVDYDKALKGVDAQLHQLKTIIESAEPHDPIPITQATATFEKTHRITIPYPEPRPAKDAPYKLAFAKPAQCNVVGSYVFRTMTRHQARYCVDMVVQMPRSLFQDKDFQDMRYFYRRAYYIAVLAATIREESGMNVEFEFLHDNRLLPVLLLTPIAEAQDQDDANVTKKNSKAKAKDYAIRIIPCAPESIFPASKLTPASACNRQADDGDAKSPTPFYNSTLKAESTYISYLRVLTKAKNECPGFVDACVLGRIWLQQRGFGSAIAQGGFGHFEWSLMVALLMQSGGRNGQGSLSTSLSAMELFKAAIQFLSETDFNGAKPVVLGKAAGAADGGARDAGPAMLDPKTHLNILHKATPWSTALLHRYAKTTTELLADDAADKFAPIFIVKANVLAELYDAVFEINSADITKSASSDGGGAVWANSHDIYKVLKKAYGPRAELIHIQQPAAKPWSLAFKGSKPQPTLVVGVIFNGPQMAVQLEKGPPAEDARDAARFRQFWGDKAELRRFQDGSILECVDWSARHALGICEEMTRYVLARHVKLFEAEIAFYGDAFVHALVDFAHTDKAAFDAVRRAFLTFESDVRNLDDLPLSIRQIAPVSPMARYTSITPPLIGAHTGRLAPVDVNLFFEHSTKWPENLVAIQEAKIEFLLDMDRRLAAAHDNITTHLGRDNRDLGDENLAYLDVVYDSGAAFRVRIYCDLEGILLDQQVKSKHLDAYIRNAADDALARFRWQFHVLPLHTTALATACTRLPALSPAIRLVKQWFARHKLASHFSHELIELFVLHVFLHAYPWATPSSGTTGFLRTLDFLARWDWRDEPLIIDTAGDMTNDERASIAKDLAVWRNRDPNMNHLTLFVATSSDHSGEAYTRAGPSRLIASRMTMLAKAASKLIKAEDYHIDPVDLFDTNLQDYDVLFHLSPKAIREVNRAAQGSSSASSKFKNLDGATGQQPLPVRAAPVAVLMEELQRVYEGTLVFFHGAAAAEEDEDDTIIGAIWNPKLKRTKFRAGLPYNFHAVGDEGEVEVNKQAVLCEIARIGGAMFKKIEEVEEEEEEEG
ncbi:Nrap protein [Emericellopsis atlantica]|uniref:U3 small nucleolar RNA-associated protein 22 n=1 Tax=Emericellopsis atlantica TaxID=2614577 RepID=A0A9P7ZDU5_9HYPO|nr:Nrap protein [Emericellopsis atlantica]KAG9250180.1 Nrap protein [Emericellopsis atlantica]